MSNLLSYRNRMFFNCSSQSSLSKGKITSSQLKQLFLEILNLKSYSSVERTLLHRWWVKYNSMLKSKKETNMQMLTEPEEEIRITQTRKWGTPPLDETFPGDEPRRLTLHTKSIFIFLRSFPTNQQPWKSTLTLPAKYFSPFWRICQMHTLILSSRKKRNIILRLFSHTPL